MPNRNATTIRTKSATVIGMRPAPAIDALLALREQLAREEEAARIQRIETEHVIARLARGTRDIPLAKLPTVPQVATRSPHYVGDDGPTDELKAAILAVMQGDPAGTTFQEIIAATGARGNRVSGAIVKLQRDGHKVRNLGDARTARWYCAPTKSRSGR